MGGGRGGGRYAGEAGGALVARVLRPARAEVVASYTASTTPPCRLDCCWHDPNQAWWLCACAGSPPLVLLKTTLPLPCLACCRASFAHPQNQKPLRTSTSAGARPRQPFASRSPSPCRYPTVSPRNTPSAQELGFRARGFTQTSQSWSGSRMLGEPGPDPRNLWLGSQNLG